MASNIASIIGFPYFSYLKGLDTFKSSQIKVESQFCTQFSNEKLADKLREDRVWMNKSKNYVSKSKTLEFLEPVDSIRKFANPMLESGLIETSIAEIKKTLNSTLTSTETNSRKNKRLCKKRKVKLRKGDWVCPLCDNLNFHFRAKCNICAKPKVT